MRRLVGLILLLAPHAPAEAQVTALVGDVPPAPAPAAERAHVLSAARDLMRTARHASLVTIGLDGHPQARVVDPRPPEPDLTVWVATNPVTRKVREIEKDARVTLFYFDPSGPGYVTLLARASLVDDPREKAARWKAEWAPFYKDAHRGADFVLIRCTPIRLELSSEAHGLVNDPATWRPITLDFP
jgi:general stress protein 26